MRGTVQLSARRSKQSWRALVFMVECVTAPHSTMNERSGVSVRLKGSLRRAHARP